MQKASWAGTTGCAATAQSQLRRSPWSHWQDNFDSFDYSRWLKSDGWGFGGNSSTFYSSQVYTENGALVLKMDK